MKIPTMLKGAMLPGGDKPDDLFVMQAVAVAVAGWMVKRAVSNLYYSTKSVETSEQEESEEETP
jgi:hypothetical protein